MAHLATRDQDEALDIVQDSMVKLVQKYADRQESEWGRSFILSFRAALRIGTEGIGFEPGGEYGLLAVLEKMRAKGKIRFNNFPTLWLLTRVHRLNEHKP